MPTSTHPFPFLIHQDNKLSKSISRQQVFKAICSQGKAGCSHIGMGCPLGTLMLPKPGHEYIGS